MLTSRSGLSVIWLGIVITGIIIGTPMCQEAQGGKKGNPIQSSSGEQQEKSQVHLERPVTHTGKRHETSGRDAEMILFLNGQRSPVSKNTEGSKFLEATVVGILETARFVAVKVLPEPECELKGADCLEILFPKPIVIREASSTQPPLEVLRAIVPLAGPSIGLATPDGEVNLLYIYQEENQKLPSGPYGTEMSIAPIKEALRRMDLVH